MAEGLEVGRKTAIGCLLLASAARRLTGHLVQMLHGVGDLQQRGHHLLSHFGVLVGLDHGGGNVDLSALAAAGGGGVHRGGLLVLASGLLAHELALGAGAESGLLALPVALGLLAHGGADSVGCSACSAALGRSADGLALGAIIRLAQILGAANVALRLVAVNLAGSARSLLAVNLALGSFAHRVASSGALRVIALPSALGVALGGSCRLVLGHHHGDEHSRQNGEQKSGTHREVYNDCW